MWAKGGVQFFHWQFQCPLLNVLESAGFEPCLRIHDGDECAANIPRSSTLTTTLWTDMNSELDCQPIHAIVSFSFIFYLDSFSYLDYLYFTWRHYYDQFMKKNGQGNKLQKKNFNCGKEIHGQGKNNGQGNLHNGLIYTSPTKDRPWTGIKLLVPCL